MADKLSILYNKTVTYDQNLLQQVGTDKDYTDLTGETPLRVPETHSESNCLYVRKYGVPYEIKSVTDITDPVDTDMTFGVYALDGTLLGSRVGGGAFTAGTALTTAQACYLKITAAADVDVLSSITIDTDIDVSGLAFTCETETVLSGKTLNLYLAENGDTYYDSDLKYGGKQTAQDGSLLYPYDNPKTAYEALDGSLTTIVTILDSETYILHGELDMDIDSSVLQSAAGETPTIKRVIGATTGRKASQQYNNTTAIYFNENGNDSNAGTWQEPFKTPAAAITARSTENIVYGGSGAGNGTVTSSSFIITDFNLETDHEYYCTLNAIFQITGACIISGFILQYKTSASRDTYVINIDDLSFNVYIKYCSYTHEDYYAIASLLSGHYDPFIKITGDTGSDGYLHMENISGKNCFTICSLEQTNTINVSAKFCYFDNNEDYFKSTSSSYCDTVYIANSYFGEPAIYANGAITFYMQSEGYFTMLNCYHSTNTAIDINDGGSTNETIYIKNCIFDSSRNIFLYNGAAAEGITNCVLYNVSSITGFTETGTIDENPRLYINYVGVNSLPGICFKYSIPGAYKGGDDGQDCGCLWRIIKINEDNIKINGIIFDSFSQAIEQSGDFDGHEIKNNKFVSQTGYSVDIFSSTDTDSNIINNIYKNTRCGIYLAQGGNDIIYSLFHTIGLISLAFDYNNITHHNTFFNCLVGVYVHANSTSAICQDSIFNGNTEFDIDSNTLTFNLTYSLYDGIIGDNVTALLCYTSPPLFIDTSIDDFRLSSIANGQKINSPGLGKASDGSDIGAYSGEYIITDYTFTKFQASIQPDAFSESIEAKGHVSLEDITGGLNNYAKAHKRIFTIGWSADMYSIEAQRKELEYIISQIPTAENNLPLDNDKLKLLFLPDSHIVESTGAISTSAKTITDSTATYKPNELKGFWADICRYHSDTYGTADNYTSVISITGAAFTTNALEGYFLKYGGSYYYIKSNTSVTITVSDPNEELPASLTEWQIVKFFRIVRNTKTVLYLLDDETELFAGTYKYIIDFIEVKIQDPAFAYSQVMPFDYSREYDKTGYTLTVEES
jgi:hypothetical protein